MSGLVTARTHAKVLVEDPWHLRVAARRDQWRTVAHEGDHVNAVVDVKRGIRRIAGHSL